MVWIKRNIFFVIGSAIALVLIGVGVFFLITTMSSATEIADKVKAQYAELKSLNDQKPHPGNGTIDNIKIANEQRVALKAYASKVALLFQRIPGIPDHYGTSNKISNSDFAAQLRNTVSELRKTAAAQSVYLPADYYFSFESQRKVMIFDPTGLDKLAVQLGEVKALSGVFFQAKVNDLVSIRREPVSTNDNNPQDYLTIKTLSTPLADFSPYEVTFRCFSSELASVMSQMASSQNGFIIKTINVEPSPAGGEVANETESPASGPQLRKPGVAPAPAPVATGSSQNFISEGPLRVTMLVDVVKLKPIAK